MKRTAVSLAAAMGWVLLFCTSAPALEITPKLRLDGNLAGVYQYQSIGDAPGFEDGGRGAVVFQPALSVQLSGKDLLYAKFGFAAGNALNAITPFGPASWAADLEADVKGINGRDRDYLLTAWYQHAFDMAANGSLSISGGIIDATEYLDQNAYANDEFTQFMNSALVNAPNAFLPSYDKGAAALWVNGNWSAAAVYMSVGENDAAGSFNFYGIQVAYKLLLEMGEGNYRFHVNGTSEDFNNPEGHPDHSKFGLLLSCDQQFGRSLGAWVRIGWQDDDALIEYERLLSGGIDIGGDRWARDQDNIGVGLALLDHGNSDLSSSKVIEIYYRWVVNETAALTLDFQYLIDAYAGGEDPKGLVSGLRLAVSF
ncbi:MAG: porin [Desulfobacteraceae bacterium]|nr:MAG: porin [Desulfobacteraceae bacterium]